MTATLGSLTVDGLGVSFWAVFRDSSSFASLVASLSSASPGSAHDWLGRRWVYATRTKHEFCLRCDTSEALYISTHKLSALGRRDDVWRGDSAPTVRVEYLGRSAYLWRERLLPVVDALHVEAEVPHARLKRLDIRADYAIPIDGAWRDAFVTKASYGVFPSDRPDWADDGVVERGRSRSVTSFNYGTRTGGAIFVRIYDKVEEAKKRPSSAWVFDTYGLAVSRESPLTRVEFALGPDTLDGFGCRDFGAFCLAEHKTLAALWSALAGSPSVALLEGQPRVVHSFSPWGVGSQVVTEGARERHPFISLRASSGHEVVRRRPLHPFWQSVQASSSYEPPALVAVKPSAAETDALYRQALGCLKAVAVLRGTDLDTVIGGLYSFAVSQGLVQPSETDAAERRQTVAAALAVFQSDLPGIGQPSEIDLRGLDFLGPRAKSGR